MLNIHHILFSVHFKLVKTTAREQAGRHKYTIFKRCSITRCTNAPSQPSSITLDKYYFISDLSKYKHKLDLRQCFRNIFAHKMNATKQTVSLLFRCLPNQTSSDWRWVEDHRQRQYLDFIGKSNIHITKVFMENNKNYCDYIWSKGAAEFAREIDPFSSSQLDESYLYCVDSKAKPKCHTNIS